MSSAYSFEDFLEKSVQAATPEDLFNELAAAARHYGYDRIIFSIMNDSDLPEAAIGHGTFFNYPSDWQKFYNEQRFDLIDPVLKCAATYDRAFTWAELEMNLPLTDRQHVLFRLGEEAGLNNGIGIPIRGARGRLAGLGLASSERQDACHPNLDMITALCNQFYIAYKRFYTRPDAHPDKTVLLSAKETEVLKWLGAGKTDEEIAIILNISKNTVDTHVRHIFSKLEVHNRVAAVVRGVQLGLISL